MSYNRITIIGNLTKAPELMSTQNGTAVTNITVAVNRMLSDGTDFINCTAWRKTAEFICRHFDKGKPILIEGEMRSRKYTDKDGVERTAWYVETSAARFVGNKQQGNNSSAYKEIDVDDDELPFD